MNYNHAFGQGRRTKRVLAVSVTAALALTGVALAAVPSNAAVTPTTVTPDLSKAAAWATVPLAGSDFAATKLPGTSTPAIRMSNWISNTVNYGAAEQFESPAVAAAGPRGTSDASYDTFQETFTLSAASYATQPGLVIEVSPDRHGSRTGGDLLIREEAGQKLTLTNFHLKPGATTDNGDDWAASTATVDFTKALTIKYVAQFNPDASKDIVKVYLNGSKTAALTGSTFETYDAISGQPAQSVDALNFRATNRQVAVNDPAGAWTSPAVSDADFAALKGKGFYISGLSYGVSNTAAATPIEFAVPTIAGTAAVGATLTAGTDTDEITNVSFGYQWLRNGKAISKATGKTYVPTTGDYGKRLSVKVTASKPGYTSSTRTSASTAVVVRGTIVVSTAASITGNAAVGSTLTAHITTAPAATYGYQWWANNAAIKGATSSTHVVSATDIGKTISVVITPSKSYYTGTSSRSAATVAVVAGTLALSKPTLSGTAKVGSTLTAKTTATSGALVRYSFYAGDVLVQLSTSPKLLLTWDLAGQQITVRVSAQKAGYTPATSASSAASALVK